MYICLANNLSLMHCTSMFMYNPCDSFSQIYIYISLKHMNIHIININFHCIRTKLHIFKNSIYSSYQLIKNIQLFKIMLTNLIKKLIKKRFLNKSPTRKRKTIHSAHKFIFFHTFFIYMDNLKSCLNGTT